MIVADQSEIIAFLEREAGRIGTPVERIATHISHVFMAGETAFKLKRAVRFNYLDFSSPERRLASCEAELQLNRRTAPELYVEVRRITRDPYGALMFDGSGNLVDAVVVMRRFDQRDLFDSMALRGDLTPSIMTELANRIVAFHRNAAVSLDHGGSDGLAAVLDINDEGLRATSLVSASAANDAAQAFRRALARHAGLLENRRRAGKVRHCHGDLILRNICLYRGTPTLFDCIEFDESLATIDVLYDLAFLLMDLWHREQFALANLVLNRYLDVSDEADGLGLVPFFMAVRSAVRTHVMAAQAGDAAPDRKAEVSMEARSYFELAQRLLRGKPARLVAIGGLSGSGKSTLAAALASHLGEAPGARVLNTDRIRKRLHGIPAETRLPESAYRPEVSTAVYSKLRQEAAEALASGCSVVVDAVFDRPVERAAIEAVATRAGVPFDGFWLEAPTSILFARVRDRRDGPSDATAEVLTRQLGQDRGPITWRNVSARGDPAAFRDEILGTLGLEPASRSAAGVG